MTKIKIVRRDNYSYGCYHHCYDTCYGFTGIPNTWPFMTKWVADKKGLSEEELKEYIAPYITNKGKVKIIVKAYRQY